jgi:hypothetical protein
VRNSFLFPHSAFQFRAQLSRRDSQAESQSASTLKSFDDIEKSFDEECPLPPRGDLVRWAGAFWVALIMFWLCVNCNLLMISLQDLKEVEQASFFFS